MAVPLRFLSTEGVFLCGKRGHIQSVIRTWLIWEWGWKGKHSNFSAESENVWTLLSGEVADIDHESLAWRFRFLFFIPSVLCWLWIALTISRVHEVRPCRNGGGVQRSTWWGQQQIIGDTFICHTFSYFELSKLGEGGNFNSPVEWLTVPFYFQRKTIGTIYSRPLTQPINHPTP